MLRPAATGFRLGLPAAPAPLDPWARYPRQRENPQPPPPSRTTTRRTITQVSMCHHLPTSAMCSPRCGLPAQRASDRAPFHGPRSAAARLRHELEDAHSRVLCLVKIGQPWLNLGFLRNCHALRREMDDRSRPAAAALLRLGAVRVTHRQEMPTRRSTTATRSGRCAQRTRA
jgi:hypothetical protein